MKTRLTTETTDGVIGSTTFTISTPIEDSPLLTKEEQDDALLRSTANDIHSIKADMSIISLSVLIVAICQIVQCFH